MNHYQNIVKLFKSFHYKHDRNKVFEDFLYLSAAAFSNAVDKFVHYEKREAEYLRRIKQYDKDDVDKFSQLLGELIMCFEKHGPSDYLGKLYMDLELGSADKGQFFTPYPVSLLMAQLTLDKESIQKNIEEKGYFTIFEPTVGAGGMVIAAFQTVLDFGYNPQVVMRVTSQDIDFKAVLMTYIQSTILGIDNTVILGNTLLLEEREIWRTPSRFMRLFALSMEHSINEPKDINEEHLVKFEEMIQVDEESGQLSLPI